MPDLPAGVTHARDRGGRAAFRLQGRGGEALVTLLGAHVQWWRTAAGDDVLWTSAQATYEPGMATRGGVPIVFPWFGAHPHDPKAPAHGFARIATWRLAAARPGPAIELDLGDDAATRAQWPHAFRLRFTVDLAETLRVELRVENTGRAPFAFEEALHTYFAVGDVHSAELRGLAGTPWDEFAAAPEPDVPAGEPLRFRAETDRIFRGVPDRLELRAPALRRTIAITTNGARSAVVWNPWPAKAARMPQMGADEWTRFVCVESANVRRDAVELAPGASQRLGLSIAATTGAPGGAPRAAPG
jgi:glucose-6-phosphate 1-epimerase